MASLFREQVQIIEDQLVQLTSQPIQQSRSHKRRLQLLEKRYLQLEIQNEENCLNGGKFLQTDQISFYCRNEFEKIEPVNQTYFNQSMKQYCQDADIKDCQTCRDFIDKCENRESGEKPACYTQINPVQKCYCPPDFYGDFCENHNSLICSLELDESYEKQVCPHFESFYFISNYTGDPPCSFVDSKSIKELKLKINCFQQNRELAKEGIFEEILGLKKFKVKDQIPQFDCEQFSNGIRISKNFSINLRATAINWKDFQQESQFIFPIKNNISQGQTNYNISLDFSKIPTDVSTSGRYYFDFDIEFRYNNTKYSNESKIINEQGLYQYFEQKEFQEPIRYQEFNLFSKLFIAIIILIGITLLFLAALYLHKKKKKDHQKLIDEIDNQNYVQF